MATRQVDVVAQVPLPASSCWAILRAFDVPWHPAIATMQSIDGGKLREFTTQGDDTLYRERLSWLSDADRTLCYWMVDGIAGADRYEARISVTAEDPASCTVRWQADIEATPDRADPIAQGTEHIFHQGIAALPNVPPPPAHDSAQDPAAPLETLTLKTDPALTLTKTALPTEGQTLCLFLHGIGGGRQNWAAELRALSGVLPAAALDLRGYGDSRLGHNPSTVESYCNDILAVQKATGARQIILCGLSYGAWIATSFALRHPDRLAGLILAGGCTGMSEAPEHVRRSFLETRQAPLHAGLTPADLATDVLKVIAGPTATDDAKAALRASMAAIPTATYLDALHCFTHPTERFDFAKLTVPALLMTGAHDKLAPPDEIRSVAQRMFAAGNSPFVRFEVIEDAGHVCNLEQPAAFNAIMRAFVTGLTP